MAQAKSMKQWLSARSVALLGVFFLAGFLLGRMELPGTEALDEHFARLKREFRLFAGLPKFWIKGFMDEADESLRAQCPERPIVIATGGQSNAGNAISSPIEVDTSKPVFTFFDGHCYYMGDPILGATGERGSLWTALGHMLAERYGRSIIFINGAVGGSQVGDWLDDRSGYRRRLQQRIADAAAHGLDTDFMLWHQGETDAKVDLPRDVYRDQMLSLVDWFYAEGGLPPTATWFLFQASICRGAARATSNEEILAAQADVIAARPKVVLAGNTDRYGMRYRHDDCHFNHRGRELILRDLMEVLDPYVRALESPGIAPAVSETIGGATHPADGPPPQPEKRSSVP